MSRAQVTPTHARRIVAVSEGTTFAGQRETPDIETSSDAYAQRFSGRVGAWFLQVQEQAVLRLLVDWPRATVLDIGGGHGQLTGALVREGYAVTVFGSDEACRRRIQSYVAQGQCRFTAGNLLHLPYPAKAFDVVVSVRLLAHMEDWPGLIRELTRVARHAVVVDYPPARSFNSLSPALFNAKRRVEGNTRTFHTFQDAEMDEVFAAQRFTLAARKRQFFWPMVGHRVLKRPGLSKAMEWGPGVVGLTRWLGSPAVALFTRSRRP